MPSALSVIDATGNHVPQMRNHAGGYEYLPLVIEIHSPRITETVSDDLKTVLNRVIAPHTSIDLHRILNFLVFRKCLPMAIDAALSNRLTHHRGCREPLATVEPTVWAPDEAVERFMAVTNPPARQANFNIVHIRLVVTITIGNEKQIRGAPSHNPSKPQAMAAGNGIPSMNTFRVSIFPSPSTSSKIRIRLFPSAEKPVFLVS